MKDDCPICKVIYKCKQNTLENKIDYVINIIKPRYIKENIKLKNKVIDEIVDLVCKFDINEESIIIKNSLQEDVIDMESWFLFSGTQLKHRWDEVIKIINDNIPYLLGNYAVEMIDYLKQELAKTTLKV
jgi:hypothetical protein